MFANVGEIIIYLCTQDAGEVYGERSVLATEVNELENRLLNLSEERDKSLSVLDEVRAGLFISSSTEVDELNFFFSTYRCVESSK